MKPFNARIMSGFRKQCISVRIEMHMHINNWYKLQTPTGMKHVLTTKLICDKDQVSNSEDQINEQWNACFVQMLCAFKHVHIFKMYYKLLPIFKFDSLFIFRLLSFLKTKNKGFWDGHAICGDAHPFNFWTSWPSFMKLHIDIMLLEDSQHHICCTPYNSKVT